MNLCAPAIRLGNSKQKAIAFECPLFRLLNKPQWLPSSSWVIFKSDLRRCRIAVGITPAETSSLSRSLSNSFKSIMIYQFIVEFTCLTNSWRICHYLKRKIIFKLCFVFPGQALLFGRRQEVSAQDNKETLKKKKKTSKAALTCAQYPLWSYR